MPSLPSSTSSNRDLDTMFVRSLIEQDDHKGLLLNLLAVIHRDGGHYTELAGLETSVVDAFRIVPALFGDIAALKARLAKVTNG